MKRFWIITGSVGAVAAAGALLAVSNYGSSRVHAKNSQPSAIQNSEPRPVRVHRVSAATPSERTYTGVVKPRYETDLGFRVAGKIITRSVEIGDQVLAGQVIAQLDPTDYELAVQIAEAELVASKAEEKNAIKEEARFRRLAEQSATSDTQVERAIANLTAATAHVDRAERSLSQARNRLAYCTLKADADGVVTALSAEVGQVVAEGTPITRVARMGELEAVINLPENRADDAKALATVTVWGEEGLGYRATLRELSPSVDATTRTYQARFSIHDPGPSVMLGRTVTIHLSPDASLSEMAIPLTAVMRQGNQTAVWKIEGDQLVAAPVVISAYHEEMAIISDGVESGDEIVAAGVQKIDAGIRVRPWEGK
jgi:multidrug efflux system membrane fusion protein